MTAVYAPDEEVRNSYLRYLMELVRCPEEHKLLLAHLYLVEAYAYLDKDQARIDDGRKIREDFKRESVFINFDSIEGPCNFLEFLIGISMRLDFFCTTPELMPMQHLYFWHLVQNIGLLEDGLDVNRIDKHINTVLERKFSSSGQGGLFPLKHPEKNQIAIEIWYQMSCYVKENPRLFEELSRGGERWISTE